MRPAVYASLLLGSVPSAMSSLVLQIAVNMVSLASWAIFWPSWLDGCFTPHGPGMSHSVNIPLK